MKDFDFRDLRSPQKISEENPEIQGSLRYWLEKRAENGFDACTVAIGKTIYIHEPRFNRWLADHLGRSA